jgi:hypothetical protein
MVKCIVQMDIDRFNDEKNIEKHIKLCRKAAENGAELIVFPELSITGYERADLKNHYTKNDARLNELRVFCKEKNLHVIVGAPILEDNKLYIGSILLNPSGQDIIYKKMNLHTGEEVYYSEGHEPVLLTIGDEVFFLGICYDIEIENHIKLAKDMGATCYVSSIFYSENGMKELPNKVVDYGRSYDLNFLVSNYHGSVWEGFADGKSHYYNSTEDHLTVCPNDKTCLMLVDDEIRILYE